MDLPKIKDLISCGDQEYLENLTRLLIRSGFSSSGVFIEDLTPQEALNIGKRQGPREATRRVTCEDPNLAYYYARDVDKGPRDDTRLAACENPGMAYWYARYVDEGPREDTRRVACEDPHYAYQYARFVDKGPRDDTRLAACGNPEWAYRYARFVDQRFQEETWTSVRGTDWESRYPIWVSGT